EALNEMRQDQLLDNATDFSWMQAALDQCARYELKFNAVGGAGAEKRFPGYKRTVEGTIPIRFDPSGNPISPLFASLGGLIGSTDSSTSGGIDFSFDDDDDDSGDAASNPFLSAHECVPSKSYLATLIVTACGPGHADARDPTRSQIQMLDLKHLIYEL